MGVFGPRRRQGGEVAYKIIHADAKGLQHYIEIPAVFSFLIYRLRVYWMVYASRLRN